MKIIKERIEILKEILPYINKYKSQWIILLFLKVGQKIPILLQPLILKFFIDRVIQNKNASYLIIVIIMFIGVYLLETLLKICHRTIDNSLFNKITKDLRIIIWGKYMKMPINEISMYQITDMVRRLNFDIDMVKFFLIGQVYDILSQVILLISSMGVMFILDWRLAIVANILLVLSLVLSETFGKELEENAEEDRKIFSEIEECVNRISFNWKEIKANQLEMFQEKNFNNMLRKLYICREKNMEMVYQRNFILDIKEMLIDILGMYVAGGILNIVYGIAASTVIACIGYYNSILQAVHEILRADADLKWIKPSIIRVLEILNYSMKKENKVIINECNKKDLLYMAKDVSFKYNNSTKKIIKKLNFDINLGEKVLLEGESGSGKSTLIQLLTGELYSKEGTLFFHGIDIKNLSEREIYKYVRKIDQNTYFMNISIKEYLLMSNKNASFDELKQACIEVNLWNDFNKVSPNLEYFIGEDGANLSKGQKQKLALARLLLNKNKIIMLDEAFSAIDVEDKVHILERLLKYFKDDTVICVAHDVEIKKI